MEELLQACGEIAIVTMVISFAIGSFFTLVVLLMMDLVTLKRGSRGGKGSRDGS